MTRDEQLQQWRDNTIMTQATSDMGRRAVERGEELRAVRERAVDRDPCTYCGTRADYGCKHQVAG
jgi:hypothetical protein